MDSIIQALLQDQQALATENPYLNASKAMSAAGMPASNDPKQNAISQSIVAALSGLANGYGRNQVKQQQKELGEKVANALAGPADKVGSALAETSPAMGTMYELQMQAARRKQAELDKKHELDLKKFESKEQYKDRMVRDRMSLKATYDATRDAAKANTGSRNRDFSEMQSLRKEFQTLPEVKAFVVSDIGLKSLQKALQDSAATSDLELIRGAIQAIEPGMAVREGEAAAVESSASIPEMWKGAINKALSGGTALPTDVREGIVRIAERRYEQYVDKFNGARGFYQKQATGRGLDPDGVTYLPAVEMRKASTDDGTTPATVGDAPAQIYTEQQLAGAGYSPADIKNLREKGLVK